jgi:hypothetical protein
MSLLLMRRACAFFGSMGVTLHPGYFSAEVFRDPVIFFISLSSIVVALIILGLLLFRYGPALAGFMRHLLPDYLHRLAPIHALRPD